MKRLSLGIAVAAALGFVAGPVSAADLPVKAPPVVMPALYNWSGVYIGVEGGAVMGQNTDWQWLNASINPLPGSPGPFLCEIASGPSRCVNVGHPLHGGFVGGEIGLNWQAPGSRWVFGIEADGNWSELEEALTCPSNFNNLVCGSKVTDFETVRGRIGYAFGPRGDFLAYVTGGWATATVDAFQATLFPIPAAPGSFPRFDDRQRHNGFTVGGGFEYGITSWLSLKAEALYVWLEGKNHCFSGAGPLAPTTLNGGCAAITETAFPPTNLGTLVEIFPAHVKEDFVLFRMGLNARFWWGKAPTPVVARY
jgi:outer membrane immunogenic protein